MTRPLPGDACVGTNGYVPQIGGRDDVGRRTVRLLRQLSHDVHVVVWSIELDSPKTARSLHGWMKAQPQRCAIWGRVALRLGQDAASPIILKSAMADEEARLTKERERRREEQERIRLSREITLYCYDPRQKRPSLGFERGTDDRPFFRMTFGEKWERDRVVDWLRQQRPRFAEMDELFSEFGQIALERHILDGMRATERDAKARGISAGGRRPLRFWRGE